MAKKNTLVAWTDLGVSAYGAIKTRNMSNSLSIMDSDLTEIKNISITNLEGTTANLIATSAVYELLTSHGEELRTLSHQMRDYNDTMLSIKGHLDDDNRRELITGKRRVLVLGIKKELEIINELIADYPEYALLMLEHLRGFIEENDISITNFQHTSFDELTKIDEILSSVDKLYQNLVQLLKEADKNGV